MTAALKRYGLGILAIAVYLMTLRKTSGGMAHDFLQRLATKQRNAGSV